jgi:hypothetical protein
VEVVAHILRELLEQSDKEIMVVVEMEVRVPGVEAEPEL